MTPSSKPISNAWLCVGLLWFVACLNYLDRIMLTTMRESIEAAIPMTDAQFGLLTSIFLWVYGLLSPLAGFVSDRFSRKGVIIVSLLVWSGLTWLTGHAASFHQLLCARALMGLSEACYIPAAMSMIMDYHRGPTRSLASGIHVSGFMVGSGLGGLGGLLAERHGWDYAFNFFGLFGIGYSAILFFLLREPPRESLAASSTEQLPKADFFLALKSLFSRGSFFLILIYWGLLGLAGWAVAGWMPTYFTEQFHLAQGKAGLSATGFLQIAALVGVILGGFLADRFSRKSERGRITICLIGLCFAAPAVLLVANTSVLGVAIAALMVYGLTRSFTDTNMMPILCLVSDPRYRATGYGILNFFACLAGGITVYAGGWLRDAHVDVSRIFEVAAAGLAICALILVFVKPTARPNTTENS